MSRDRNERDQMKAEIAALRRELEDLRAEVARLTPRPAKATTTK